MMRTLVLASAMTLALTAQPAAAETRAVATGSFTAIDAADGLEVSVSPGAPGVVLDGDPAYFDKVTARVENGVLKLRRQQERWWGGRGWRSQVKLRVSASTLRAIEVSSGADVIGQITTSGVFVARASSGGHAKLSGTGCTSLTAHASSGGSMTLKDLQCVGPASLHASSGGDLNVSVAGDVSAHASSGGKVDIHGTANLLARSESSGGSVSVIR
jgi:hypothetical protein